MISKIYDPVKEWEQFDFPLEISNLQFEKNLHGLSSSCTIKIWRDENYKLRASLSGYHFSPNTFEENIKQEGPGNFAELDVISGVDTSAEFTITLTECLIGAHTFEGIFYDDLGLPFSADLHFTAFTKKSASDPFPIVESIIQYDWFICSDVHLLYPGSTTRFYEGKPSKERDGIDPKSNSESLLPKGFSRDFFVINHSDFKCIVALVPKEFKLPWANCMCIEYRSSLGKIPENKTKKSIEQFVGFILGTEFSKIGSSVFANDKMIMSEATSPSGSDVRHRCQDGSMPPIKFNVQYSWGDIQSLSDSLFPIYCENYDKLNLDGILWRFFQAREMTVGVNLPILASALELFATNYLKLHKEIPLTYLPKEEYLSLIDEELKILQHKLLHINGHEKILNKIKSAYYRGPNEKLELFFQAIDLPLSKLEKDALQERNSMAHGGSDAKTSDEAKTLVLKTRVYETLFHRVLLRMLRYKGYYIDYYLPSNPSKKITQPTGVKDI